MPPSSPTLPRAGVRSHRAMRHVEQALNLAMDVPQEEVDADRDAYLTRLLIEVVCHMRAAGYTRQALHDVVSVALDASEGKEPRKRPISQERA